MHPATIKMKKVLQVLVVAVAIIAGLNATKINKCKGKKPPPIKNIEVELQDCTGEDGRCILNRGQTYEFQQRFKAPKNIDTLETAVLGSIFNQPIRVTSADDSDVCSHLTDSNGEKASCPLKKGQTYVYKKPLKIKSDEYWANINLQWYLKSGKENITCFGLPVRIQEKKD